MNQKINPNPSSRSSSLSLSSSREAPKELRSCPRCKSNNTKFCYYNNYSLTQPRYFCKSCRRYWTEGGSLRNVPVGGGSRKSRKSITTTATTTAMSCSSSSSSSDHFKNKPRLPNYPSSQDLNVAFPCAMTHFVEVPKVVENMNNNGFRGLSSFIPNLMPNSNNIDADLGYHSLPLHEFKPSLGINCVDGFGGGPNLVGFQELNQNSCGEPNECDDHQKERQQGNNISSGFWSGMLGGGSL